MRTLQERLFHAEQELQRVRTREGRFEQTAFQQLELWGVPLPRRLSVAHGPAPDAPEVVGHLDVGELRRDPNGRYHLALRGWAWSWSSVVMAVDVFLGETRWGQLDYGNLRPDVRQHFGGPPEMEACGFSECLALPESFQLQTRLHAAGQRP